MFHIFLTSIFTNSGKVIDVKNIRTFDVNVLSYDCVVMPYS